MNASTGTPEGHELLLKWLEGALGTQVSASVGLVVVIAALGVFLLLLEVLRYVYDVLKTRIRRSITTKNTKELSEKVASQPAVSEDEARVWNETKFAQSLAKLQSGDEIGSKEIREIGPTLALGDEAIAAMMKTAMKFHPSSPPFRDLMSVICTHVNNDTGARAGVNKEQV